MIQTNHEKKSKKSARANRKKRKVTQPKCNFLCHNQPQEICRSPRKKKLWANKGNSCVIKKQQKHHCYMYVYHTLTTPNLDTCTEISHLVSKALTAAPYILSPTDIRIKEKTIQVPSNCICHYTTTVLNPTVQYHSETSVQMTTTLLSPLYQS